MSKNRLINTNFWKDNYVIDLDPTEKLLFNYLFTNPHTTVAGIYEISDREIAFDCGIDKDMVAKIVKRFEDDDKLTYINGWMFLHNAVRHQSLNPSIIRGIERVYDDIPDWLRTVVAAVWTSRQFDKLLGDWVQPVTGSPQPGTPKLNININGNGKGNKTKPNAAVAKATQRPATIPTETIQTMLDYWKDKVGMDVDTNGNRRAVAALLRQKNMDEQKLRQLIDGVAISMDDRYAPRISDFTSLKRKMNDLLVWGKKMQSDSQNRKGRIYQV